jgi:hypothetical protein
MHTRRHLLVAVGAAATAGCTSALGDESGEASGTGGPEHVRLDDLSVQNNHDEEHRLQLGIEADSEMLHLGTYDLDAEGGSRAIEGAWGDEAGSYRVHVRLDDESVRTADVTEGISASAECVRVLIRIDGNGDLAVWNGANCESNGDENKDDLESV